MRFVWLLAVAYGLCVVSPANAKCDLAEYERFARQSNLPSEGWALVNASKVRNSHTVDVCHLNPFYLRGDFDGDTKPDFLLRLNRKESGESGLAAFLASGDVVWLVRDEKLRFPTPSAWYVQGAGKPIHQSLYEAAPPPSPKGEVIVLSKLEASTSLVYWNGERFASYWVGD